TDDKPITLPKGVVLQILDQVPSQDTSYPNDWYKIRYVYMATGDEHECYIYSDNVTKRPAAVYSASDEEFEKSIMLFPESYKPYLRALHSIYPNWTFEARVSTIDFNQFVKTQAEVKEGNKGETTSQSSIHYTREDTSWRKSNALVDGKSWYHAADDVVAYYSDPRNFLNEVDIFQFESLGYSKTGHTAEGVQKLLSGTFMENATITDTNGNTISYADAYMIAAEQSKVSPYSLAISTILENGKTGTMLTNGSRGYYNFFGIGSVPGGSPQENGLAFAKTGGNWSQEMKNQCLIPWDTPYKAIVGGALFMGKSYISIGQNTAYFKKFDVFSLEDGTAIHQYMQDIEYPVKEAYQAYKNYSSLGILAYSRTFIIPVFQNMPEIPVALPGTTALSLVADAGKDMIISSAYKISGDYISGIQPGVSLEAFKSGFVLGDGVTMTINGDKIGTSTAVKFTKEGLTKIYTVVIRGDINGDSEINVSDLLMIRNQILETTTLTPSQMIAANIDGQGGVEVGDLLNLRNGILGTYTISQENIK
ncbi:MAG: hypothetical protein IKU19_04330, partial [Clostridia bacterium]|nr:hypothetical protein [Clostridia bacterium]